MVYLSPENSDLWALAANVAIKAMGGPEIATKVGRADAGDPGVSVESQVGRLPDGDKGCPHLRAIFEPKGFSEQEIVALSGAHTVGRGHADRSGFEGPWTKNPLKFDNEYYTALLEKKWIPTKASTGNPQYKTEDDDGTMMMESDIALLEEPFKQWVVKYAADQTLFSADFTQAWLKIQSLGLPNLREKL